MTGFPHISFAFLLTILFNSLFVQGLICPPEQDIAPCKCNADLGNVRCHEWFGDVTQDLLNKVAESLRQVNNVNPDQWLEMNTFHVAKTPLASIDLTPFLGIRLQTLSLSFSSGMTSFLIPQVGGRLGIEASRLQIISNNLDDFAIEQLLKSEIVAPNSLKSLLIGGNRVGGAANEFVPGLTLYPNLEEIDLQYNEQPVNLAEGQFSGNGALRHLDLARSALSQIGQNAFLVNSNGNVQNERLDIDLSENGLTDASFSGSWYPNTRPASINLSGNQLEFISEGNFQPYLNLNGENQLELQFNKIVCGQNTKWLKDAAGDLERRVFNAWCSNDPGKTVFTTNL